jgi:hypothetical protein
MMMMMIQKYFLGLRRNFLGAVVQREYLEFRVHVTAKLAKV